MVSQPSFLFGQVPRSNEYLPGSLLSVTVAALVGVFAVLSAQTKDVSVGIFMSIGGLTSLAFGLIHIFAIAADKQTLPEKDEIQVLWVESLLRWVQGST